jgi:hypothetical protein
MRRWQLLMARGSLLSCWGLQCALHQMVQQLQRLH